MLRRNELPHKHIHETTVTVVVRMFRHVTSRVLCRMIVQPVRVVESPVVGPSWWKFCSISSDL